MLNINLNLPTIPTQNEKDAMDGANTPSTTNVFSTANDLALKVPYTGATSDVNLGEFGIQLGNLEFDNTPTNVPTGAGSLNWNDTDGTLDLKLKGGNVTLQIGQEQVTRVVNKTATNITLLEANYQAVRITGAQGQRLKADLALATTNALSAETIGLVTETIANNQEGFITTSGLVRGINTTGSLQGETWADGDIVYLSGTTAGNITNIKPTAPTHLIVIGYVVYSHGVNGSIYVKVDNGYELDELHNVLLTSSADKDILAYESSTSLWKNKTASSLGIAPLESPTFTGTVVLPSTTSIGNVSDVEIGYLDGVTSAIQTQLSISGYLFRAVASTASTLNASTTYKILNTGTVWSASASDLRMRHLCMRSGTAIDVNFNYNCVASSAQNSTLRIVNVTTSTNVNITTTLAFSTAQANNQYQNISFSYTKGDVIELQVITGAFVTAPTSVTASFEVYFR
jgi:hypothetical protein